ncbi:MAG: hypothetical protein RIB47_14940 [Cyclobacteriaceae bacterium]
MKNVVTSFCSIRNRQIVKDGQIVFRSEEGLLQAFLEKAYSELKLSYPRFYKMDRLSQLGWLASEIIFGGGSYPPNLPDLNKVGLVLANRNSSLDSDIAFHQSISKVPSPSLFVYTLPNIVLGEICIRNGFKGENAFFVQESFDTSFLVSYVDMILSNGNNAKCLAGWVDVLGEDHDVFLYFVEKIARSRSLEHDSSKLLKLYNTTWIN